jgi:hypothetical protein
MKTVDFDCRADETTHPLVIWLVERNEALAQTSDHEAYACQVHLPAYGEQPA